MKLTKTQRLILNRLADGRWIFDRAGRDGMAGWMSGPYKLEANVSSKTVSFLLRYDLITVSIDGITAYKITPKGREAIRDAKETEGTREVQRAAAQAGARPAVRSETGT